jgi:integrase
MNERRPPVVTSSRSGPTRRQWRPPRDHPPRGKVRERDRGQEPPATPEEAGRLLACFPLFWWDHMVTLLGTGLRFGELAGLRRRRIQLNRAVPVLEVGPTRYQAGRFGSGFKPRPKSDAGIRPLPLAPPGGRGHPPPTPSRQRPRGPGVHRPRWRPGRSGGPSVPRGARTVLSRHNLHRAYQGAVAKLADPAVPLRPTARRVLRALREGGPQRVDRLAARLSTSGRRPVCPATIAAPWESCTPPAWRRSTSRTRT